MAKHMCTDHEELYKNLLKPQMKVGNELVSQVSNKILCEHINVISPHIAIYTKCTLQASN